jgi:hypothetical protein
MARFVIKLFCGLVVRVSGYRSPEAPGLIPVVGLEQGPPFLVSTIEELLRRKNSGFGLEIREYGCGDPLH